MQAHTQSTSSVIVMAISTLFFGVLALTSSALTLEDTEISFRMEALWATQVDPRWNSGASVGDIEDGITAEFVEFSSDGRWLVTGNGLGEAFLLNAKTGVVEGRFSYITEQDLVGRTEFDISGGKVKGMEVECGAFTPDGRHLVIGGNLNGVKVFDLRDGSLIRHIPVVEEVDGLGISPDGHFLAHAAPRSVQVWKNLSDWHLIARIRHGDRRGVTNSIDFASDASLMVSAGNYGHVILTRTADWQEKGNGLIAETSSVKSVRFSPDNRLIAAGYGEAKCAAVFRTKDMSLVKHLPLFYIEAVAWTSDGRFLMAGGRDEQGRMRVFRTSDWGLVSAPEVQADLSNIEYIDVHGDLVAVAGEDAHVRLYRLDSFESAPSNTP
jgi:WD40 repeat protein